jgi:hypothetical protein
MQRYAGNADASALQIDQEENVIRNQTFPGEHLDGKEVDSGKHIHGERMKSVQVVVWLTFGRRCNAVSSQRVARGLIGNNMA